MINESLKPVLPEWQDPFSWRYELSDEDDTLRARLDTNIEVMMSNLRRIALKIEEEWYLKLVISVLEDKGYTVTKGAASAD